MNEKKLNLKKIMTKARDLEFKVSSQMSNLTSLETFCSVDDFSFSLSVSDLQRFTSLPNKR